MPAPSLAALLAQAQPNPFGGSGGMIVLLAIFCAIFYFLIVRPQRKQEDDQKKFLGGLQKGDEVISASGIVGKVDKVADNLIVLEVANNVRIRVLKSQILGPYKPPEAPAQEEKAGEKAAEKK